MRKEMALVLQILEHSGKLRRLEKGKRDVVQDNQLCAAMHGPDDVYFPLVHTI